MSQFFRLSHFYSHCIPSAITEQVFFALIFLKPGGDKISTFVKNLANYSNLLTEGLCRNSYTKKFTEGKLTLFSPICTKKLSFNHGGFNLQSVQFKRLFGTKKKIFNMEIESVRFYRFHCIRINQDIGYCTQSGILKH